MNNNIHLFYECNDLVWFCTVFCLFSSKNRLSKSAFYVLSTSPHLVRFLNSTIPCEHKIRTIWGLPVLCFPIKWQRIWTHIIGNLIFKVELIQRLLSAIAVHKLSSYKYLKSLNILLNKQQFTLSRNTYFKV